MNFWHPLKELAPTPERGLIFLGHHCLESGRKRRPTQEIGVKALSLRAGVKELFNSYFCDHMLFNHKETERILFYRRKFGRGVVNNPSRLRLV